MQVTMGVNADIQKERNTCSFNVSEFTNLIYGGAHEAKRSRELAEIVSRDPVLTELDFHRAFLNSSERYERALQKFVRFQELKEKYRWSDEEQRLVLRNIRFDIALGVHFIMFIPALRRMASDEQLRKWLPLVTNFRVIGTYCQTEMGHGTNLRQLETRADYDRKSEQFVINTPHISSMKWWPGGLGLTVNHVLLLCQLYIDGQSYGMQAFIVPIRDLDTHMPLPGVEVGDIGPRMSSAVSDNGFLRLTNIKISRKNMLMKSNEVSPDGRFIRKGSDKATYSTMILIRAGICGSAWELLSIATTIATRYSAVRRQSQLNPAEPEPQIMDFQTQQMKLIPSIASTFAIYFTHKYIRNIYDQVTRQIETGDISRLNELHVQSAGFKAFTTDILSVESEILRRSCGGHGYLLTSGLPFQVWEAGGAVIYEGENTVLYLQAARYLLKQVARAQEGSGVVHSLQFLTRPLQQGPISNLSSICMGHVDIMMEAFKMRTHYFLLEVNQTIQSDLVGGLQMHDAINRSLVNLVRVTQMYLDGCMIDIYHQSMNDAQCSTELKTILFRLFYFHMVHRIVLNKGDFLECGALTNDQIKAVKREEIRVLGLLRPDAVGIMDSFNYTDNFLMSALGRFDGNVYDALYAAAKQSPLNATKVHPAIEKHLLPLVRKAKL